MVDPEIAAAAAEVMNGAQRFARAVGKEMEKQRTRAQREEPPIQATGEETYVMYVCTVEPQAHYFTPPPGAMDLFAHCSQCRAPIRRVLMRIVEVQ
jgi:hypothetical protein